VNAARVWAPTAVTQDPYGERMSPTPNPPAAEPTREQTLEAFVSATPPLTAEAAQQLALLFLAAKDRQARIGGQVCT
jgi:hypothetical protein